LRFSFGRFLLFSAIAAALWMTFWSALIFVSGQAALALANLRISVHIIVGWIVFRLQFRKRPQPGDSAERRSE
jgi:membrane protein DedA with SNARE-associated domain